MSQSNPATPDPTFTAVDVQRIEAIRNSIAWHTGRLETDAIAALSPAATWHRSQIVSLQGQEALIRAAVAARVTNGTVRA